MMLHAAPYVRASAMFTALPAHGTYTDGKTRLVESARRAADANAFERIVLPFARRRRRAATTFTRTDKPAVRACAGARDGGDREPSRGEACAAPAVQGALRIACPEKAMGANPSRQKRRTLSSFQPPRACCCRRPAPPLACLRCR